MALYVVFYINVGADPGFKYTHYAETDGGTKGVLVFTAFMLLFYYVLYFAAAFANFRHIGRTDISTKVIFTSSQVVHAIFIVCGVAGVYN